MAKRIYHVRETNQFYRVWLVEAENEDEAKEFKGTSVKYAEYPTSDPDWHVWEATDDEIQEFHSLISEE